MTVFDCEADRDGNLLLIGINHNGKYRYFKTSKGFWEWVKKNKIVELWAHNIEYDFFKTREYIPDIKFCAHYSTAGCSYVQAGNIIMKDLYNHLPFRLAYIGKLVGKKKFKIDYETMKFNKELIRYNRRDCLITYLALKKLEEVYLREGSRKIKSTSGSQAMDLYLRKFFCGNFERIKKKVIEEWRASYHGGWVECFIKGKFDKGTFYKIDINSLFPAMMYPGLPYPYQYSKVKKLTEYQRHHKYWIGIIEDYKNMKLEAINSIEDRDDGADYYYVFKRECFPFRSFVKYFYDKKSGSKGIEKFIYKKLLNSLYGKFGQGFDVDIISNYNFQKKKRIFYEEQIKDDLYRIKYEQSGMKFWVNIVWSSFVTAKARQYMYKLKRLLDRLRFKNYYIDTDCFIIQGNIKKIDHLIDSLKMGLFKIEDMSNEIEVKGKKMYRFGEVSRCVDDCKKCKLKDCIFKCKGVPREYRREFFANDYVQFKKMLRYKEAIVQNKRLGTMIDTKKENKQNVY